MKKVPKKYIKTLENIPTLSIESLHYVMENIKPFDDVDDLWMEFGVASGSSINYISKFTKNTVYGFDSFEGLPEYWREGYDIGAFNMNKKLPQVNQNVELIQGLFQNTLEDFLERHKNKKISFMHIDADLYSSTKYILNATKNKLKNGCIIVFDELLNYPGFDGQTGELLAWYEFSTKNDIQYEWVGMKGKLGDVDPYTQKVSVKIL